MTKDLVNAGSSKGHFFIIDMQVLALLIGWLLPMKCLQSGLYLAASPVCLKYERIVKFA